jgi:hypothetical protein
MSSSDPPPPPASSQIYRLLHATALAFIHSLDEYDGSSDADITKIRAVRTQDYTHSWGHNYFVSTKPPMQGAIDLDGFLAHMRKMLPRLESVHTCVGDVAVDEANKMVVVRASYWMKVNGHEAVENDLIWWLWMDENGEKVKRSVELLDAEATKRIAENMAAGKSGSGEKW